MSAASRPPTISATGGFVSIAQTVACTEAEGPGRRFAIWFQGCPLRCPGCCNPEMLPFTGGERVGIDELVDHILAARRDSGIEGITLLGGEPFAHADGADRLAAAVRDAGLSVMIFTGHLLEDLEGHADPHVRRLLAHADLLVDGPYDRTRPETRRRWIGSTNQRVHFLSSFYAADDPRWRERNSLEIRFDGESLTVNGFPAASAVDFWKRPRRRHEAEAKP